MPPPQNTSRLTKFVAYDTLVTHKRNEMKRIFLPVALAADYLDLIPPRPVPAEAEPGGHTSGPGCWAGLSR